MKAFRYMEMKIFSYDAGHMTKMATMPIYGKNPSKIFFSATNRPRERGGLVVNASDSGSRGRGFEPHSGQTVLCP